MTDWGAHLHVDDLSCVRGGRRVFSNVSFTATPGSLFVLRGPNGAGKSTLLRALAGLLNPERGAAKIESAGAAPVWLPAETDAFQVRVAYAGHLDAVKPSLTVVENLSFWARAHGAAPEEGRARVAEALEAFALTGLADTPAGYCSAGQKRRIGLARLSVARRPLWLLDEPTVSLDAASIDRFGALLRAHLAMGGVAIVASHTELPAPETGTLDLSDRRPDAAALDADPFLDPQLSPTAPMAADGDT